MPQRKRLAAVVSVPLLSIAVVSAAQTPQSKEAKIARAMQAAPESISKNATIVDTDGTVLRSGSNGWHCHPIMAPGSEHPMCNDDVWMRFMTAYGTKADFKTDRVGISYMLAGDDPTNNADPFDDGKRDPGEVWVTEGPHLMIVVPDAKMLEGISDDPTNGGPYVMFKGTTYAHIMVPVAARPTKK
jgi:hypothetical protein